MVEGPAAGVYWERAMIARSSSAGDYAVLGVSLGLAAVFIYAGFEKIHDPLDFADSIAGFGILPVAFINPFALALPLFEIACGLLLLWPPVATGRSTCDRSSLRDVFRGSIVRPASRRHA